LDFSVSSDYGFSGAVGLSRAATLASPSCSNSKLIMLEDTNRKRHRINDTFTGPAAPLCVLKTA